MTERDNKERKMSEVRLFGKTIELPETAAEEGGGAVSSRCCDAAGDDGSNQEPPCSSDSMLEDGGFNGDADEQEVRESLSSPKQDHAKDEDGTNPLASEELKDETEAGSEKMVKNEDDQNETSNSHLKKPDKILPCPRCNSMDTKFCYFNNYNVNQPRHFCKNCQRHWTAGGTMRNVPVGAGRRKNKNSLPQFRHLTDSARVNIVDKTNCNTPRNGFHRPEEVEISVSDSSSGSSIKASNSKDAVGKKNRLPEMMPNGHPFPQQVPCYPGPSLPVLFYAAAAPPYPGAWNVPYVMQRDTPPSSGPTLGKHPRDDNTPKPAASVEEGAPKEINLWFPKTLRIDDTGEAAKSSIWATLGIYRNDLVHGWGLDFAFGDVWR